jgi:hypothetical protein
MQVFSKRTEVFVTIKEWLTIGGGAQDILDDVQLYNAVWSFLESASDHFVLKATMFDAPPVQKAWEYLVEVKRSVISAFKSQTMRPTISRHNPRMPGNRDPRTRNMSITRDPPDLDRMDPEAFVDNIDGMASAALSNVTQEVWLSRSKLLNSFFLFAYDRNLGSLRHCRSARSSNFRSHWVVFISRRWLIRGAGRYSDDLFPYPRDRTFLANLRAYARCSVSITPTKRAELHSGVQYHPQMAHIENRRPENWSSFQTSSDGVTRPSHRSMPITKHRNAFDIATD